MLLSAGVVSIVTVFLSNVLFLHVSFIFAISISQEEYYLVSMWLCVFVQSSQIWAYVGKALNLQGHIYADIENLQQIADVK